jgi:hypothetical protein
MVISRALIDRGLETSKYVDVCGNTTLSLRGRRGNTVPSMRFPLYKQYKKKLPQAKLSAPCASFLISAAGIFQDSLASLGAGFGSALLT